MARGRYRKKGNTSKGSKFTKKDIKRIDKEIHKLVPQELKQFTNASATPVLIDNHPGIVQLLNGPTGTGATAGMQQGTQRNQRIGDVTYIKRFKLGWTVQLNQQTGATSVNSDTSYRLIILFDKQARGVNFPDADILTFSANQITGLSDFNVDTVPSRYRILHDKLYNVQSGSSGMAATANASNSHIVRMHFKTPLKTYFTINSVNSGIAAIDQGALFAWWVSTGPIAAGSITLDAVYSDIVYTDA